MRNGHGWQLYRKWFKELFILNQRQTLIIWLGKLLKCRLLWDKLCRKSNKNNESWVHNLLSIYFENYNWRLIVILVNLFIFRSWVQRRENSLFWRKKTNNMFKLPKTTLLLNNHQLRKQCQNLVKKQYQK